MADAFKAEIEDLKKKLSQNPDSLTFVPLAEAYRKSGMYKEAVEICRTGLEKHPAYTSARVVLGRLYLEQELFDEASEELKKVEAVDHDNIMVHSMLGNIYVKKQMFAQAVEQFQRVLSLNPEDMETQEKLQEALSAKQTVPSEPKKEEKPAPPAPAVKEEKPAMTDLQKSLKVAELYSKKEEFDKAIEIYRELLEKDAENIIIQQRLREVYDLQQKKINKQKEHSEKRKSAESDKITAEDILDVMKEAVENDLVDEEKTEPPAKKEEPKKETKKEEPKKEEPKKEEAKKEEPKKEEAKKEEPKKEETKKEEPKKEEVKKEEPKKEEAKKETVEKAPEISDNKKIEIGNVLQSLSTVDGIVGSLFLLRDGQLVASVLPTFINKAEIGGIVASIVDKTEQSVKNMKQGKLNQVVIASEKGQLLFTELGKGVLFMIGDESINVGKMGLVLKQVKEKLKQLI